MLEDEDLVKPPFNIEKQTHRRAVLAELERVKALGVKPPQNLWEYKVSSMFEIRTAETRQLHPKKKKIWWHCRLLLAVIEMILFSVINMNDLSSRCFSWSLPGGQCRKISVLAVRTETLPSSHHFLFVFIRLFWDVSALPAHLLSGHHTHQQHHGEPIPPHTGNTLYPVRSDLKAVGKWMLVARLPLLFNDGTVTIDILCCL